jgi:penicillin-binding protein 1A
MVAVKKSRSNVIRILWVLVGTIIVSTILFFTLISNGAFGFMPTFKELENPKSVVATEIITTDNKTLGRFYKDENRSLAEFKDLSPNLVKALIATEDERFYRHSGIDLKSFGRAVKGILTGDSSSGGGSTISQQLAKLLFPRESNSGLKLIIRKFREWVIAVKLERSYTKEEIITMYLNKFEFINGAFGVQVASKTYFNKTPDALTLEQAALLVGMLKNPFLYNPTRFEDRALQRRNVVLGQMYKNKYISKQEFEKSKALPLNIQFQREELKKGIAPYFRKYLERTLIASQPKRSDYGKSAISEQKYHEDSIAWVTDPLYGWCNKNRKPDGEAYDLYKDGLKIYTTIDYRMQKYAEESVEAHLKSLQPKLNNSIREYKNAPFSDDLTDEQVEKMIMNEITRSERYKNMKAEGKNKEEILREFNKRQLLPVYTWSGYKDTLISPLDSIKYYLKHLSSSFMAMDPRTGEVKAWVGGSAYGFTEIDMVRSSTFKRQVGSTCKPFLYTLAMQNGISPCEKVPNVPVTFTEADGLDAPWTASNSSETDYDGKMVSLRWGLANSVNQVSAYLMKQFNPEAMKKVMQQMGVYSNITAVPAMFLGTAEITLYEMVAAYSVFANKGVYTTPMIVTRIEDKNGNLLATFQPKKRDALDEQTAYLMTYLLQGVVREGTGVRLATTYEVFKDYGGFKAPFAGKTGTTQNQSDGWFIGFTPELVAGVWTGANYRSIHFKGISLGQGSNTALPVFGRFFKKVFADPTLGLSQNFEFEKPAYMTVDLNCDETDVDSETSKPEYDDFF